MNSVISKFLVRKVSDEENKKEDKPEEKVISKNENQAEENAVTVEVPENESSCNVVSEEVKEEPKVQRKVICLSKIGSDHYSFANTNNQDFAFNILNMKVVTDGCGSGKHSEVGTKLFGQLIARKAKELYEKKEAICEENFIDVINEVFNKMLMVGSDAKFIFENYCFTILFCFEFEDEFVVYSCGDGYILTEESGHIFFEKLDDGEYPCYYVYNFIEDKSLLKEYQDGVEFKVKRYPKEKYSNIGVASDGLRFAENLIDIEKIKFKKFLSEGKSSQIERIINKNNRNTGMFHDDISICF